MRSPFTSTSRFPLRLLYKPTTSKLAAVPALLHTPMMPAMVSLYTQLLELVSARSPVKNALDRTSSISLSTQTSSMSSDANRPSPIMRSGFSAITIVNVVTRAVLQRVWRSAIVGQSRSVALFGPALT